MLRSAALAAALAAAAPAHATTFLIDFEDQPNTTTVASPVVYPEATFTSSTGQFFINGAGLSRDLCPVTDAFDCTGALTVDFGSAISFALDLSFTFIGDDRAGDVGSVAIFRAGTLVGTAALSGADGDIFTQHTVDLSGFGEINRLVITSTDAQGLAYDNFAFDIVIADDLPAPSALALFGLGLTVAAAMRRRHG